MNKSKKDNIEENGIENFEQEAVPEIEQPEEINMEAEMADLNDRLLRLAAEYDNYRKRTEREKQASVSYGISGTIETLLPAFDVLEKAALAECADAKYKKGIEMTVELFKAAFAALGVSEIEAEGKPFDPELHSAVSRETKEGVDSETVVTVLQKGYKLGDKVIRHSVVIVAE